MPLANLDHGVGRGILVRRKPAGEYPSQSTHIRACIRLVGVSVGFQNGGSVQIQFDGTDRKQLHDFTRIVFVGRVAGDWVCLFVASEGQVGPHCRCGGHLHQQVAVISECIGFEYIHELANSETSFHHDHRNDGQDKDLRQRQCDPLAQHRGAGDHISPHGVLNTGASVIIADAGVRPTFAHQLQICATDGFVEFRFNPSRHAQPLHSFNRCGIAAKCRHRQKARCLISSQLGWQTGHACISTLRAQVFVVCCRHPGVGGGLVGLWRCTGGFSWRLAFFGVASTASCKRQHGGTSHKRSGGLWQIQPCI